MMERFDESASKNVANVRHLLIGALGFGTGVGSILILSAILMVSLSLAFQLAQLTQMSR